jgi:polar amino acid transport system substrate-binding protein
MPRIAGLILGIFVMSNGSAGADALKDELAPTGKLRVGIAISPAGGAFWSTKTENGFAGVPVDLGKAMAAQLGVPIEYVPHNNSGQIVDAVGKRAPGMSPSCRRIPSARDGCRLGPIYEAADATYIVKADLP